MEQQFRVDATWDGFAVVPVDLDNFVLASEITQTEAMKYFVELFRQQKGIERAFHDLQRI